MVGVKRTHEIHGSVFSILILSGTISPMVTMCVASVSDTVIAIRYKGFNTVLAHFDETENRVEGNHLIP